MILARVNLPENPADSGLVLAQHHVQILHDKAQLGQFVDDFDVREALLVGANFILAFHDVDAFGFEDPKGFFRSFEVQIENGFVIFFRRILCAVVVVVVLEVLVILVRCAAWRVHVRRIKHDTINSGVAVRQLAAINP